MEFSVDVQEKLDPLLAAWDGVYARKMFGALVYMVGGKMFVIIHGGDVVVKLPKEDKAEASNTAGAHPFVVGVNGRFGDWMQLPLADPVRAAELLPRIDKSYDYVLATQAAKPPRGWRQKRWA